MMRWSLVVTLMIFACRAPAGEVTVDSLLDGDLARAPDMQVLVSRVHMPANTTLPRHWHPSEEFLYVLEGPVSLHQDGADAVLVEQGEVRRIAAEAVHTASTGDNGATVLVFRVHPRGEPVRMLAE